MKASSVRILRGDDWSGWLQGELMDSPLDGMAWMQRHTKLLKSDEHSRVGLMQLRDSLCYLKFYRAKSAGQSMLFRLGYARALRSYDAATALLVAGVRVPVPRSCLLVAGGLMLLNEGIVDGKDLKTLWQETLEDSQRGRLMADAGCSLAKLHTAGYSHGDCKWSNFLCSAEGFYLVDLEAVIKTPAGGKRQARDLARFTVNAEDMGVAPERYELFLDGYLADSGHSRDTVIRAIMPFLRQLRQRHELKYGQRGRPILREP